MSLLIHGGRIMTMDPALGDIDNGEILVREGRIVAVGRDLDAGDARPIDARGQFFPVCSTRRAKTSCASAPMPGGVTCAAQIGAIVAVAPARRRRRTSR